jgi:hypothetical protein
MSRPIQGVHERMACPEPAGYVVEFTNEGNIVGIGFAKGPLRAPQIEVEG